jgi:hypothetical protein
VRLRRSLLLRIGYIASGEEAKGGDALSASLHRRRRSAEATDALDLWQL